MDPSDLLHEPPLTPYGEVVPPVFQNSLFAFTTTAEFEAAMRSGDRPVYTRIANPTVRVFEEKVAALEGTEDALAFASGNAAMAAVLFTFLEAGDRVVAATPVYAGTYGMLTKLLPKFGVEVDFVPGHDTAALVRALAGARLLLLESPTSYTFELQDLAPLTEAAREHGVLSVIDNTYGAGVYLRPARFGVDLVVHSATKYFSGHSDVVAGVVAGPRERLNAVRSLGTVFLGGKLAPWEAWLLVRGLRTLELRLERHQATALELARFLEAHPKVRRVLHPGLESHPQHELARRYLEGTGGLFAVELAGEAEARAFADALERFAIGVSWGGHESLVLPLAAQPRVRAAYGFPPGLVRLFAGLEPAEALKRDLEQALARVG
ncbi:Cys/Met metabolism pyridoxal-phosphate-dependent protein [Oceanithermus profundus DSM 14977]|uniref:Cys/Met metabolism pyridoxal-phosphate-dependent protein n=1 Tax=Oceanithermus profundus (strain DSM 14977 / NBRC 100410 / VKM B-2274 / 506) TaxID=670487 RepID=E4U935_OCEP5|nr:PLP-dependent aspartate aminotransferase family protein [Oceanithermus profundus]ADR36865.1 Cys/Met metabolism pyridoxal-phosphate-dependent protein [Oceanithermus profundus DSM 14977]